MSLVRLFRRLCSGPGQLPVSEDPGLRRRHESSVQEERLEEEREDGGEGSLR